MVGRRRSAPPRPTATSAIAASVRGAPSPVGWRSGLRPGARRARRRGRPRAPHRAGCARRRCRAGAASGCAPGSDAASPERPPARGGSVAQSGSRVRTAASTSLTVSPSKSRRPVSISHSTTPKAQMSARLSTGLPRACSGDMYAAVPRMIPAAVPVWARVGDCDRSAEDVAPALAAPRLRQAEVEHLDLAVWRDLHVGRLQVAVDDALLVRVLEGLGDLLGDSDRLVDRNRPALQSLREVLALDQLHDQDVRLRSVRERHALEAVEVGDVGVVEGGQDLGLALEPGEPIGIGGEGLGEELERDLAAQGRVGGAVDLTHAPGPEGRGDLVVRQGLSDQDRLPSAELSHSTTATTRHLGERRG